MKLNTEEEEKQSSMQEKRRGGDAVRQNAVDCGSSDNSEITLSRNTYSIVD